MKNYFLKYPISLRLGIAFFCEENSYSSKQGFSEDSGQKGHYTFQTDLFSSSSISHLSYVLKWVSVT